MLIQFQRLRRNFLIQDNQNYHSQNDINILEEIITLNNNITQIHDKKIVLIKEMIIKKKKKKEKKRTKKIQINQVY